MLEVESAVATNDCSEIGRGPCPCGEGLITVEWCIPDHPWAKESQAWYRSKLVCENCEEEYGFFGRSHGKPDRLVLISYLEEIRRARDQWYQKLKEIESSPAFRALAVALDERLARERSAAARYRLLRDSGLAYGMSLPRYRRHGYTLEPDGIASALQLLGIQSSELLAKQAEVERLWKQSQIVPPGIETGINGLEM